LDKKKELEKLLIDSCEEILPPDGEIFELKINKIGDNYRVFLTLDKMNTNSGSFSSEEITKYSKEIYRILRENNFLTNMSMEVSTPGIERPLRDIQDYKRFVGQKAKIFYLMRIENSGNAELSFKEKSALFEILDVNGNKISLKKHRKKKSTSRTELDLKMELDFHQIQKGKLYRDY